jgi:hypothetical protein
VAYLPRGIKINRARACSDSSATASLEFSEATGARKAPFAWKVTAEEVKVARGYNLDIKNPHTVADDHGKPEELLTNLKRL